MKKKLERLQSREVWVEPATYQPSINRTHRQGDHSQESSRPCLAR